MARHKDADKRAQILAAAKRRFADRGFEVASMAAIASDAGLPVGSLYTYFSSKEDLFDTVIEEGWQQFSSFLKEGLARLDSHGAGHDTAAGLAFQRLSFLVYRATPLLLEDADFITILLGQAGKTAKLESKLEYLASLISQILGQTGMVSEKSEFDPASLRSGIAVMLLGSLESVRLIRHGALAMSIEEILAFLVTSIETALGCSLSGLPGGFQPSGEGR
jgi:AcrR family transcriptional regulator